MHGCEPPAESGAFSPQRHAKRSLAAIRLQSQTFPSPSTCTQVHSAFTYRTACWSPQRFPLVGLPTT